MLRKIRIYFGLLLISIGVIITIKDIYIHQKNSYQEKELQSIFFTSSIKSSEAINDYYNMIIEIPKINLKKGLFHPDSINNNVDKNILVLKQSQMPDIKNTQLILAGHSGNSEVSYFRKISQLSINDIIYIYYKEQKYLYQIYSINEVNKTGYLTIEKDLSYNKITLITCKPKTKDKQLVVEGKLKGIFKY